MSSYILRADKIITVTDKGTIHDGALFIQDGKIVELGSWKDIQEKGKNMKTIDCRGKVVTPSLIDCHTHLLEFAPPTVLPVTEETHGWGGKTLLFQTLSSGVTGLGEQVCGFPLYDLKFSQFKEWAQGLPMDIRFSLCTISIGFEELKHFSAATSSQNIQRNELLNEEILEYLAKESDYPGENIFINATPANFQEDMVPNAGKVMYTQEELNKIAAFYHSKGKSMGAHVGGECEIDMALNAGIDVLHHAHGISDKLIEKAASLKTSIVATPIGGTHLMPNSPQEVAKLVNNGILVAISTDGFLPPHKGAIWIEKSDADQLLGPESLMSISHPSMKLLRENGWDDNDILALITLNPAKIMKMEHQTGSLKKGLDATFIVADGIPGLDITNPEKIDMVFYKGEKVIKRSD